MDQDNMFYEDTAAEAQAPAAQPQEELMSMDERDDEVNDFEFFLDLLDKLVDYVENARRLPGGLVMLKQDIVRSVLEDMRNNLPDAIQYGMNMYGQRKRILGNAESIAQKQISEAEMKANKAREKAAHDAEDIIAEADQRANKIVSDAKDQAAELVSRESIVHQAEDEADAILSDARVKGREERIKAADAVMKRVEATEKELKAMMEAMRAIRQDMNNLAR